MRKKRARYNHSELSNSNPNVFLKYLTTLPQGKNIIIFIPVHTAGALPPHPHRSHFLSQSGRSAKFFVLIAIRVYKIYLKFKPHKKK